MHPRSPRSLVPRRLSPPVVSGSGVSPSGPGPLSSVWRRTPFKAVDPVGFPELPESLIRHVQVESFRLHDGVTRVPTFGTFGLRPQIHDVGPQQGKQDNR
ncbi:hypothetical protein EYF80_065905 [Liparis tanakae]|uniref:Uncharacterized protein n=1 Tax=Liparis tanakae TaxID=230148 RepID=A0A4Z2E6K7_9TELE|nr:hypothetical protein EYF80_065905 [Liparis tanakae]